MDKENLHDRNLEALRTMLKILGQAAMLQLTEISGLSADAVNKLLRELLHCNEVLMSAEGLSHGGQAARKYCFNREQRLILAIYMRETDSASELHISVESSSGHVLEYREIWADRVTPDLLAETAQPYIDYYPQIEAVVAVLPGVKIEKRLSFIDYAELENMPFCTWLAEKLERPVYFLTPA